MNATTVDVDGFLHLYDASKPEVYGYLRRRCHDQNVAEDLTSEVFLAAVREWRAGGRSRVTVPWLITVARNKLVNHWRATEREGRRLRFVAGGATDTDLPFAAEEIEPQEVRRVLHELSPSHRAALTLKYVDGCSLAEVAELLGRSEQAIGSLLARARRAARERLEEVTDV